MRISPQLLRSGPAAAAGAVLSVALAAGPATAASGISVSTTGSTVSVTTSACAQNAGGNWGTASLLTSSQANFSQGRQVTLSGTSSLQSAAWSNVSAGTYTVVVMCSDTTTAGTQSVIVSTPTISATATASPSRGVMGGLGGATKDYGPLTLGAGAALVAGGGIAAAWFLRRRSKPYRL
ncbi:hypothetical protein ACIPSE_30775 [Streptomyces sp. NPDC090106]|uniref:hypothetical protein n=1 Tax=Streptomyces sp. NPDC090106 TaxID=3365946 RepID=UPI003823A953